MNYKSRAFVLVLLPILISASVVFLIGWYYNSSEIRATVTTMEKEEDIVVVVTEPKAILEKFGVKIERNPSEATLSELGVSSWPKYSSEPKKMPWSFKRKEKMYILEGKVRVSVDDGLDDGSSCFEIGAGNLIEFPKGMSITWHMIEPLKKHYHLEEEDDY
ncbi:uncharacterized protein LOC124932748 [Impatiens glandulifera]|uniref:uncharacterized protein LOC124932748 n=1 Tax=Impatiens glandulifera TaxID=253017 RepID=UPI001FB0794C|nr:uncharacterized protein LOC124932748 [Impatiens glandulifera]